MYIFTYIRTMKFHEKRIPFCVFLVIQCCFFECTHAILWRVRKSSSFCHKTSCLVSLLRLLNTYTRAQQGKNLSCNIFVFHFLSLLLSRSFPPKIFQSIFSRFCVFFYKFISFFNLTCHIYLLAAEPVRFLLGSTSSLLWVSCIIGKKCGRFVLLLLIDFFQVSPLPWCKVCHMHICFKKYKRE